MHLDRQAFQLKRDNFPNTTPNPSSHSSTLKWDVYNMKGIAFSTGLLVQEDLSTLSKSHPRNVFPHKPPQLTLLEVSPQMLPCNPQPQV